MIYVSSKKLKNLRGTAQEWNKESQDKWKTAAGPSLISASWINQPWAKNRMCSYVKPDVDSGGGEKCTVAAFLNRPQVWSHQSLMQKLKWVVQHTYNIFREETHYFL